MYRNKSSHPCTSGLLVKEGCNADPENPKKGTGGHQPSLASFSLLDPGAAQFTTAAASWVTFAVSASFESTKETVVIAESRGLVKSPAFSSLKTGNEASQNRLARLNDDGLPQKNRVPDAVACARAADIICRRRVLLIRCRRHLCCHCCSRLRLKRKIVSSMVLDRVKLAAVTHSKCARQRRRIIIFTCLLCERGNEQ